MKAAQSVRHRGRLHSYWGLFDTEGGRRGNNTVGGVGVGEGGGQSSHTHSKNLLKTNGTLVVAGMPKLHTQSPAAIQLR